MASGPKKITRGYDPQASVTRTLCPGSISYYHRQNGEQSYPVPKIYIKTPSHHHGSTSPHCFTLDLATASKAVGQGSRLHHLLMLYCTRWSFHVPCCKPNHPTSLLPQVPSFNAIPHRTDCCQATLDVVVRCKQPNVNHATTLGRHLERVASACARLHSSCLPCYRIAYTG
jgi:hypothetical protein